MTKTPEARPAHCHLCLGPMYWLGDPQWEPEIDVNYAESRKDGTTFESGFYVHKRCWDKAIKTVKEEKELADIDKFLKDTLDELI